MITIKSSYNDRVNDANKLINHIKSVSDSRGGTTEAAILKSSYVLLLYNNLEATVTSSVSYIHENASGCTYDQLSDELKSLYANYWHYEIAKKKVKEHIDKTINQQSMFPVFDDYIKKITVFSGNIDVRSLNDINTSYGVDRVILRQKNSENILFIKNKRNKLAHGEESFQKSCRDRTVRELAEIGGSLKTLLDKYLDLIEEYINAKKYMN